MKEVEIDDVIVRGDHGALSLRNPGSKDVVRLNSKGVHRLLDLLQEMVSDEFNRRRSFRVPIEEVSGLHVAISVAGRTETVEPVDLSITGILVECPSRITIGLRVGDAVQVAINFDDTRLTLRSILRRKHKNEIALFFRDNAKGNDFDGPESLMQMVMELQRRWLASRANPQSLSARFSDRSLCDDAKVNSSKF